DYKGNFTPHILSNLKKMSFSVETDTKSLIANIATINTSVNNLFNSKASLLVMNKYKEFTIENSGSGFTFSSKALKKIEQIITENIQATHTTHMILNTKLIIPDSVKGETVNIILNAAPYDAGNGGGSYKIKLNNITLKSSEAEVNVIKDGDLRYVNLSIPFRSSNYQGNFIPHILFNLSRMNFSVSDENGVYTTHIGYVPPTNAIKISMKQKKSTKPKKLLNISASKSGLIFNTKVLKKIEQSMESYTETRLTINAKLIIPDSIKGDTVNIILNAAPYDAGNGSGSYKIKLNNITLQSSEAEVKVMKDGDLRYVNLSIPFRSSNYQGNFIPYILPSLSMMNFSVSDDNSIYTLMIKQ
ncbi:MAG: hypothetical protein U9O86_01405, partial [Campylobacterota bacterium]|nr:hypothetical protein [Campylobacterota bacterium]